MAGNVIEYVLRVKDKASPDLKGVGTQAGKTTKSLKLTTASMKSFAKSGAIAVAAVAGVVVGLKKMAQSVADARNQLNDLSLRTGLSAQTLAGLKFAAEGSGLELGNLTGALAGFPKRLDDMANGIGEAKLAFEFLDIQVKDSSGSLRSADEVFGEVMVGLGGVDNATKKAALSSQLFGKAGTMLIQSFGGATEKFGAFVGFAEEFGTDIGPKASKSADDWQRAMGRLGVVMTGSMSKFADSVFKEGGASDAVDAMSVAIIYFAEVGGPSLNVMITTVGVFIEQFAALGRAIAGVAKATLLLKVGDFSGAIDAVTTEVGADKLMDAYDRAAKAHLAYDDALVAADEAMIGFLIRTDKMRIAARSTTKEFGGATTALGETADAVDDLEKAIEELPFKPVGDQIAEMRDQLQDLVGDTPINQLADLRDMAVEVTTAFTNGLIGADEYVASLERIGQTTVQLERDAGITATTAAIGTGQQIVGGDVAGAAGGILATAGPYGAIAAAVVAGLSAIGGMATIDPETGRVIEGAADAVGDRVMEGIGQIFAGLEALPGVLGNLIPRIIRDGLPLLAETFAGMIPDLIAALAQMVVFQLVQMPFHIAKGIGLAAGALVHEMAEAIGRWWETAKEFIRGLTPAGVVEGVVGADGLGTEDLLKIAEVGVRVALGVATAGMSEVIIFATKKLVDGFKEGLTGEFATGGYVDRTGLALVHQGERVIPASGAGTGTATSMGGVGAGGVNLTINTSVVDPNAIPALVREIERTFGTFGRGTSPLFSGA